MIKTNKAVNLSQLTKELNGRGLQIEWNDEGKTIWSANGDITDAELKSALDAHIAEPESELTVADKLASVGLSLDDLKAALGLGGN